MPETPKQFVVVASCHMNFYPGTMNPTPPDYRYERASKPVATKETAESVRAIWRSIVMSPGWKFRIEEVPYV